MKNNEKLSKNNETIANRLNSSDVEISEHLNVVFAGYCYCRMLAAIKKTNTGTSCKYCRKLYREKNPKKHIHDWIVQFGHRVSNRTSSLIFYHQARGRQLCDAMFISDNWLMTQLAPFVNHSD